MKHSEISSIILFHETCFLTSVVVQWLCILNLKGWSLPSKPEKSSIILFHETFYFIYFFFQTSVVVQWLCLLTLKGLTLSQSLRGFEPHSAQWYFISFSLYTFLSEVLASVMILDRNSLLKFVYIFLGF